MRNMIKALKKKYALSDQGASNLFKGILYSVLANISLMLPVILLAVVLNQLLSPILGIADSEKSAAFLYNYRNCDSGSCIYPALSSVHSSLCGNL